MADFVGVLLRQCNMEADELAGLWAQLRDDQADRKRLGKKLEHLTAELAKAIDGGGELHAENTRLNWEFRQSRQRSSEFEIDVQQGNAMVRHLRQKFADF